MENTRTKALIFWFVMFGISIFGLTHIITLGFPGLIDWLCAGGLLWTGAVAARETYRIMVQRA